MLKIVFFFWSSGVAHCRPRRRSKLRDLKCQDTLGALVHATIRDDQTHVYNACVNTGYIKPIHAHPRRKNNNHFQKHFREFGSCEVNKTYMLD